jgi:uncharacterized membrane protein
MKNRRFIAWVFSFAPLLITLVVLRILPDIVPTHYSLSGNADRYGSKYEMLVLPIITILMGFFWVWMAKNALKNKEKGAQNLKVLFWSDIIMTLTYTVITVWFLYMSYYQTEQIYSSDVDFMKILSTCLSIGLILLGNILPKCKPNRLIGIRTKRTLANESTWYKTHRFGGKVYLLGGVLMTILCIFVFNGVTALLLSLSGFIIISILIVIYSYNVSGPNLL